MVRSEALCLLLLASSWGARLPEEHGIDQVVFGELGWGVFFDAPALPPGVNSATRHFRWPDRLKLNEKVFYYGDVRSPTGFVVTDFAREDQGAGYSITTNGRVTNFRAVLATTVEAEVGATLYLQPEFSGDIGSVTWKHTFNRAVQPTDLVDVLSHGTIGSRSRVDTATGKLAVSDWRSTDNGYFTVEINGVELVASFRVESILRVEHDGDLHIDPRFAGEIDSFMWFLDGELVLWYTAELGVTYEFPPCVENSDSCNFDTATGKLTIKSWQPSNDGRFASMINSEMFGNEIEVMGGIHFVPLGEDLQLNPPPFQGDLKSIVWFHNGNLAAEFSEGQEIVYYTLCKYNNCFLDRTTGMLTIKAWKHSDDGTFTWDVNLRRMEDKYMVLGVKKLEGYHASIKVTYVSAARSILICDEDVEGAEPVEYFWRQRGTTNWVAGTKTMETPNVDLGWFRTGYLYDACKIKNRVSECVINLS